MSIFKLPSWIKQHQFSYKDFKGFSTQEIEDLKSRLTNFSDENPDISIVIPAWNEQEHLHRTLSSLASNQVSHKVEIIVINNNSDDDTQLVLDTLNIKNYLETKQGTSFAREKGLEVAKGKYHLCADSDTLYPPKWIESMVAPMIEDTSIVGVYGRYSFIPGPDQTRLGLLLYEAITGILIKIRKVNYEFVNVLGFNMGFITQYGRTTGGFKVGQTRVFDNAQGSEYFIEEAEDGTMALNLLKKGKLKFLTSKDTWVYTSSRRLMAEGGLATSFLNRIKTHGQRLSEYMSSKKSKNPS